MTTRTNEDQAKMWNGAGGRGWVEVQGALDRMLQPFEDRLVEAVRAARGTRVLDVGCGTGSTSLAIARLLGAGGSVTGADISAPMLELARQRARSEGLAVDFVLADAQTYAFPPHAFDTIVSRFGVMFFDDSVAAFANLRRAAAPSAKLWFAAWRSAADNPFMTAAERAAAPYLPSLPPRDPAAPGQFAFAERASVERILAAAGWRDVRIEPLDASCSVSRDELERYLASIGPIGRALGEADEATRARVIAAVRRGFEPYVQGDVVSFNAACWAVRATA